MVGVPRSRAIADCPTGMLALDRVKVEVLMEDVTGLVDWFVSTELTASAVLLLVLLVATAAPFKLFIRAEALLRAAVIRFLGASAAVVVSPVPGLTLDPRLPVVVLMLAVDTPAAVSVVMDGCVAEEEEAVTALSRSLELISGLFRRPCCCCSSVVVPTGAGSGFPK